MTGVTLAAAFGRMHLPFFNAVGDVDNLVAVVGVPIVVGWVAAIAVVGGYSAHVMGAGATEYKLVVRGALVAAGTTGVVCYLMKFQFSRGFFFLLIIVSVPALLLGRVVLRRVTHALRRRGRLVSRVVVAGAPDHVDEVARVLDRERWLGYQVVGAVVPATEVRRLDPGRRPGAGHDRAHRGRGRRHRVRHRAVRRRGGRLGPADAAGGLGARRLPRAGHARAGPHRRRERPRARAARRRAAADGARGSRAQAATRVSKRVFDLVGASVLLVLSVPFVLATAIAIKVHDGGPVIFRQRRVGRNGDLFDCCRC